MSRQGLYGSQRLWRCLTHFRLELSRPPITDTTMSTLRRSRSKIIIIICCLRRHRKLRGILLEVHQRLRLHRRPMHLHPFQRLQVHPLPLLPKMQRNHCQRKIAFRYNRRELLRSCLRICSVKECCKALPANSTNSSTNQQQPMLTRIRTA